ncbi:hypothetical protein D6779_04515 [Candidatus Parcubacteria bacterium]|nr:MAG: hypothetical protein D6779_04515 [Candidatus Parcubacteria bacterium]
MEAICYQKVFVWIWRGIKGISWVLYAAVTIQKLAYDGLIERVGLFAIYLRKSFSPINAGGIGNHHTLIEIVFPQTSQIKRESFHGSASFTVN